MRQRESFGGASGCGEKFLFKPVRQQEYMTEAAVPNSNGITGLAESALDRLQAVRQAHPMRPLNQLATSEVLSLSQVTADPRMTTSQAHRLLGLEASAVHA
ncbi:hypothetical protein ABZW18_21090 [Streptomyces sp. NPDC004647]|uniref:hypothetical protein n=1 Tax=Streptomyces sp. NPDC004647 TaxID=3154671 RepID=UPI0033A5B9EF